MNENGGKSNTILLTVIGIATLLVVVTGATFAYFAAIINGNDTATSIKIQAGNGGTITFGGGEKVELNNIYPKGTTTGSEWVTKHITLSNSAIEGSTTTSVYKFTMSVDENTFNFQDAAGNDVNDGTENMKFTFVRDKDGSTGEVTGATEVTTPTPIVGQNGQVIGQGTVANNVANTIAYTLKVFYDNADYNQQNGQDRTFSFHIGYSFKDSNDTTGA